MIATILTIYSQDRVFVAWGFLFLSMQCRHMLNHGGGAAWVFDPDDHETHAKGLTMLPGNLESRIISS